MPNLTTPLILRGVTLRNRLGLAPMTQYAGSGYLPTDWHIAHYGTRSVSQGLVIVEATAVSPTGVVTPHDLGLWTAEQQHALGRLARTIESNGAVAGIQLSHGGRKACRTRWWDGDSAIPESDGGWPIVGPTTQAFGAGYARPIALTETQLWGIVEEFADAAKRAADAGYRLLELHAGHGRLLHSFYSPVSNTRVDSWGNDFAGRTRLLVETVRAVRSSWPCDLPLGVRLSAVDWVPGGWSLADSVVLSRILRAEGVDFIDCSSGGIARPMVVPAAPGYQVPFAETIRREAGVATAAVGLIDSLQEADDILRSGSADLVLFGRSLLLDPFLALRGLDGRRGDMDDLVPPEYARGVNSLRKQVREHIPEL